MEKRKRRMIFTLEELKKIETFIKAKATTWEIADALGRKYATIYSHIKKYGRCAENYNAEEVYTIICKNMASRKKSRNIIPTEIEEKIKEMLRDRIGVTEIARRTGATRYVINRIGITMDKEQKMGTDLDARMSVLETQLEIIMNMLNKTM